MSKGRPLALIKNNQPKVEQHKTHNSTKQLCATQARFQKYQTWQSLSKKISSTQKVLTLGLLGLGQVTNLHIYETLFYSRRRS